MKYDYVLKIAREAILNPTLSEIADKLSTKFVEQYGQEVMEDALISRDELRKRVMNKLTDRIIDSYVDGGKK